jgi:hypothetical protein
LTINVVFEGIENERLKALKESAEGFVKLVIQTPKNAEAVWSLREAVWPALDLPDNRDVHPARISLNLQPLARLGQMEGKSGSLVLIGRFEAKELKDTPSHPLVVKTRFREGRAPEKLREEYDNALAVKPFIYDRKDSFAIPLWFDSREKYDVLWSLCMLSERSAEAEGQAKASASVSKDLRQVLGVVLGNPQDAKEDPETVERTLKDAYRLLRNMHRRFNLSKQAEPLERSVGEEYKSYLRGFGPTPTDVWGHQWLQFWAPLESRTFGGTAAINPVWLVERLKEKKYPMRLGVVHGDLHPGNIILRETDPPAIIDFGWSKDQSHVAKDFVLMECNLRFLTLRPQINEGELAPFCSWVAWNEKKPTGLGSYLAGRVDLIDLVRKQAREVLGDGTKGDLEYVVPLFLVAFGLLRFAPQLGHQLAAVRLVEALAMHLTKVLSL